MNRTFVHAQEAPLRGLVGHQGQWWFPLPDGTVLLAIAHGDVAVCRHLAKKHEKVLSVLPTRASGDPIDSALHGLVSQLIAAQPKSVHIAQPAGKATSHHLLDAMYQTFDDPAFAPESSL